MCHISMIWIQFPATCYLIFFPSALVLWFFGGLGLEEFLFGCFFVVQNFCLWNLILKFYFSLIFFLEKYYSMIKHLFHSNHAKKTILQFCVKFTFSLNWPLCLWFELLGCSSVVRWFLSINLSHRCFRISAELPLSAFPLLASVEPPP